MALTLLLLAAHVVLPMLALFYVRRSRGPSLNAGMTIAFETMMAFSMYTVFATNWPSPTKQLWATFQGLQFDSSMLTIECLGSTDPFDQWILRIGAVPSVLIMTCVIHAVANQIRKLPLAWIPSWFAVERVETAESVAALFVVCYPMLGETGTRAALLVWSG